MGDRSEWVYISRDADKANTCAADLSAGIFPLLKLDLLTQFSASRNDNISIYEK